MSSDVILYNTDNLSAPEEGCNILQSRSNVLKNYANNDMELTIAIIAYNRIEKTKQCVEYVLEYTKDFNYILLLCDNGSTDGTFEFFKGIRHPNKKIVKVTKNIGVGYATNIVLKMIDTRYCSLLANDAYVTKNWMNNLMTCIKSDDRIGYVAPMSSNMSNRQDPLLKFGSLEEMQKLAEAFNKSDRSKWMERKKLFGVANLYKTEVFDIAGKIDYGFFHNFTDDDHSFRMARAGYKQILCGDTFIHHDHMVFERDNTSSQQYVESLNVGKQCFKDKYYGIDAWDDIYNYEVKLLELGDYRAKNQSNILGIDVKCGTPVLEIKNKLCQNKQFMSSIFSFTSEAKYFNDLLPICDGNVKCDRIEYISEHYPNNSFDYIILGEAINSYAFPLKVLENIVDVLDDNGQAFIKVKNTLDIKTLLSIYGNKKLFYEEIYTHLLIDDVIAFLNQKGISGYKIDFEMHNVSEELINIISKMSHSLNLNKDAINAVYINEYLLCIKK